MLRQAVRLYVLPFWQRSEHSLNFPVCKHTFRIRHLCRNRHVYDDGARVHDVHVHRSKSRHARHDGAHVHDAHARRSKNHHARDGAHVHDVRARRSMIRYAHVRKSKLHYVYDDVYG